MQVVIVVEVQRDPMGVGGAGDHVDESGAELQTTFGDSVMVQFVLRVQSVDARRCNRTGTEAGWY